MKLKVAFETVELDDNMICVPVGMNAEEFHGVLSLNGSGYEIVRLLENETTPEKITDVLAAKYETDRETIRNYVEKTICELKGYGFIE